MFWTRPLGDELLAQLLELECRHTNQSMKRPAPYVPLSTLFAFGKTGTAIQQAHGFEGLGVWCALIAAAKEGNGQVVFRHPDDWEAIGGLNPPTFTLDAFLKTTGTLKQTRRTQHGRVLYVTLTQWGRWNDAKQREDARQRMSRKRHKSPRNAQGIHSEANEYLEPEPEPEVEVSTPVTNSSYASGTLDDPQTELLLAKLLNWIGDDQDSRTAAVVRHTLTQSTEAAISELTESMRHARPKHRARWVVGTLKRASERAKA